MCPGDLKQCGLWFCRGHWGPLVCWFCRGHSCAKTHPVHPWGRDFLKWPMWAGGPGGDFVGVNLWKKWLPKSILGALILQDSKLLVRLVSWFCSDEMGRCWFCREPHLPNLPEFRQLQFKIVKSGHPSPTREFTGRYITNRCRVMPWQSQWASTFPL